MSKINPTHSGFFSGITLGVVGSIPLISEVITTTPTILSNFADQTVANLLSRNFSGPKDAATGLAEVLVCITPPIVAMLGGAGLDALRNRQNPTERLLNKVLGKDFDVQMVDDEMHAQIEDSGTYNLYRLNIKTGEAAMDQGSTVANQFSGEFQTRNQIIPYDAMSPVQQRVISEMAKPLKLTPQNPLPLDKASIGEAVRKTMVSGSKPG